MAFLYLHNYIYLLQKKIFHLLMHKFTLTLFTVFSCLLLNGQILFEDEAAIRGITNHTGALPNGSGASFVDYDGDGWDDITLPSGDNVPLRFYKNIGGFFVAETLISPQITYRTRSVTWIDYDNDGDKDLFVASDTDGNRLFRHNSDGSFENVTEDVGLFEDNVFTYGISWGDVNNDGCLDLYMSNRIENSPITNYLFKNNCDGTFSDVTQSSGLTNEAALSFCSGFFDFNNDGLQDLYVANDKFKPNFLYKNIGNGIFTDVSSSSGTNVVMDAMCVTIEDFDSDGDMDIYLTNSASNVSESTVGNIFYRNNGDETFTDIASSSGTFLECLAWGSVFFDAENDRDLDLYVNCEYSNTPDGVIQSTFYENQSNNTFTEPNNIGFLNNVQRSYGSAIGDANNDGKQDVVVFNNFDTPPFLWMNKTTTLNNYLNIDLEGLVSNKEGIGSSIEISINNQKQYRHVMSGESYLGQSSLRESFGIGNATTIDYVKVKWLSGIEDVVYNVNANTTLKIIEGNTLYVNNSFLNIELNVYVNELSKTLNIASNSKMDNIEVFNIAGKKINNYQVDSMTFQINQNSLVKGIYLLKIDFKEGNTIVRKIVI